MRKNVLSSPIIAAVVALLIVPLLGSEGTPQFPQRPKLVLIVVIDQFRYDYLVRFRQQFVEGGFNLLLKGGANFVDCRYDYATTATCPGHASLFTGTYPNIHGIIGNEWYDRSLRRSVFCAEDLSTKLVGGPEGPSAAPGFSPHHLVGSTLGDELRAATGFRSKVIAISLKDRAAVMMGGHSPTAAYWFDPESGRFETSSYYLHALPAWVAKFNKESPTKSYCRQTWKALTETPGAAGGVLGEFNPEAGEPCPDPRFMTWLNLTPFMNEIELAFAREAIKNERLGQGSDTDLLAVSLSVNDYIGHRFGPYSPQVADSTLRTDRYLAGFFADLDRMVGMSNVWIALSADHGVAPNPSFILDHKFGAGSAQLSAIRNAVEHALGESFGPGAWVERMDEFYIYLDKAALKARRIQPSQAEDVAAQAAASTPGVMAAFSRAQLMTGNLPNSPLARKASNSFNPQRGGDIFLILNPYAVPVKDPTGTTHGSPWSYDAQVPMILWGSAFKPGVYATPCQPIDLVATLAAVLGLSQPSGTLGAPLTEAIK